MDNRVLITHMNVGNVFYQARRQFSIQISFVISTPSVTILHSTKKIPQIDDCEFSHESNNYLLSTQMENF